MCMLRTQPDIEIVGEYAEGYEVIKLSGSHVPDIILSDINLPSINSVDPTSLFHQWNAAQRLLVISDSLSPQIAIRALRNGAHGYLVRYDDFEQLMLAIHSVCEGRRYVSKLVTDQILDDAIAGKSFENEIDDRISAREREILQMIVEGKTNADIAKILVISKRTVETHRNNLMRKLGLSSQIEIIRYALKHGLFALD